MDNIHANYTVLLWLLQETKARIQALELLQVWITGYHFKPEQPFVEPLTELHSGRYATSSGESGHLHRPRKVTYVIINKNVKNLRPPWNFFISWNGIFHENPHMINKINKVFFFIFYVSISTEIEKLTERQFYGHFLATRKSAE